MGGFRRAAEASDALRRLPTRLRGPSDALRRLPTGVGRPSAAPQRLAAVPLSVARRRRKAVQARRKPIGMAVQYTVSKNSM